MKALNAWPLSDSTCCGFSHGALKDREKSSLHGGYVKPLATLPCSPLTRWLRHPRLFRRRGQLHSLWMSAFFSVKLLLYKLCSLHAGVDNRDRTAQCTIN